MARRRSALEGLCRVPPDIFQHARGVHCPEYMYHFVEALRAFLQKKSEVGSYLSQAVQAATDLERLPADPKYALNVDSYSIEALNWMLGQQPEEFNLCLQRGVEAHRAYFDSDKPGRRQRAEHFISVGFTAIATLAHDLGGPVNVESDYIPMRIVRGDWRENKLSIYREPFPGARPSHPTTGQSIQPELADMSDRHTINLESIRTTFNVLWPTWNELLEQAKRNPGRLAKVSTRGRDYVGYFSLLDPDSIEISKLLSLSADAVLANFQLATVGDGDVSVRLGDDMLSLPGTGRNPSFISPGRWIEGFYFAAMARRRVALEGLCRITPEVFQLTDAVQSPEYMYLFVEALRAFLQHRNEAGKLIMEAVEAATDADRLSSGGKEYALNIGSYPIDAMGWMLGQQPDKFNDCLQRGVEAHRKYYDSDRDRRRQNPEGFISFGLTAIASLAHDLGGPVNVESDYIPMRIVRGDWRENMLSIYCELFPGASPLTAEDVQPFIDAVLSDDFHQIEYYRDRVTSAHIPLLVSAWANLNWEQRYAFIGMVGDENHRDLRPLMMEVIRRGDAVSGDSAGWALATALCHLKNDNSLFSDYFNDRQAASAEAKTLASEFADR